MISLSPATVDMRTAQRATETSTHVEAEDSPSEGSGHAPTRKKLPAAFQLSGKDIPDDAGHIKVSPH